MTEEQKMKISETLKSTLLNKRRKLNAN